MGDVSAANASTTSAGDEPGVLPAALSPVLWRHLATSGPPVDLRTALAAACACRVFREVLQEVVIRGKLERPSQALLVSVCHAFPLLEGLEVDCGQCEPPPCAAKPQPSAGPSTAGGLEEGRGANSTQPWVRQQQQQQQQQQAQGYPSSASLSGFGAGEEAPGSAADSTCTSEDEDEGHHAPLDDRTWSLDVQRLSMPLGMYFDPDARSYKCGSFECIQWPALRHLHLRTANMGVGLTRLPVTSTPRLRHVMLTDSVVPSHYHYCSCYSVEVADAHLLLPRRLTALHLHRVSVGDFRALVDTLNKQPKLRVISATQLQTNMRDPGAGFYARLINFELPRCKELRLSGRDMAHLRVWAPQLRRLHLGGCPDLRSLRLLQKEPTRYRYRYGSPLDAEFHTTIAEAGAASAGATSGGSPGEPGSNSSSPAPAAATLVPQPPAVWVDLSGTDVSRYTLKQLRTHPRVGPERLVPPGWYGTGRSSSTYAHEYDSDGRLGRGGDHGSSGEDEDHAVNYYDPWEDGPLAI